LNKKRREWDLNPRDPKGSRALKARALLWTVVDHSAIPAKALSFLALFKTVEKYSFSSIHIDK
tara:strand:+ start:516 stop:704 length:189 start_codon:yes stop_codon:yes gene_type:complete